MPELKQLSDFYDPTRTGMAALNVMQNQQHLAVQQQQAALQAQNVEQQGRNLQIDNLQKALKNANPMDAWPIQDQLSKLLGVPSTPVNKYLANQGMYNAMLTAQPGTPEHDAAVTEFARTTPESQKVIMDVNSASKSRAGAATLLAAAGMPSDSNTAELARNSGQIQAQVTDALAQSHMQKEKAIALRALNEEHEKTSAYVNKQLSTLVPGAKAAELAIERAAPIVVRLDAINQELGRNKGMGQARVIAAKNERMSLDPELAEFDQRRKASIPQLKQSIQQLEDQQAQLQSRAELIARGAEQPKEGESLELLAGDIDGAIHQMSYAKAQLAFAQDPTPANLDLIRNVKGQMDETIGKLTETKKSSADKLNMQRSGLDEKIFEHRYKIDRDMKIGQAQSDWIEAGGKVEDLPKIARKYSVKVNEIRDAAQDPSKPSNTTEVNVHMPKTTEEAGKFSMMDNAVKSIDQVSQAITKSDGSIDKAKVFASYFNIPFTEGRNIRSLTQDAISAKLRAETGAAANKDEVQGIADRFDLSPFDNEDVQKDKLRRLRRFLSETRVIRDPTGKIREVAGSENAPEAKSKAQPAPAQKGKLSANEQAELDALRRKYGR